MEVSLRTLKLLRKCTARADSDTRMHRAEEVCQALLFDLKIGTPQDLDNLIKEIENNENP